MRTTSVRWLILFFLTLALQALAPAQSVLTWHNDNARTGQNLSESTLTLQNVNSSTFGKLFSYPVEGQIYTQPLYVPQVTIPNKGTFNVVYVATEHDQVYAFDADGTVTTPLWQTSFINPSKGITTVNPGNCDSLQPEVGITGTPVIDPATGTLYVTSETAENHTIVQRLHAVDITTGAEKFNGPSIIQATVNGVSFDPRSIQRTALLLLSGTIYFGYAYLCAPRPYNGWVFGYNAQDVQQQVGAFLTTPTGSHGGVWQSGAGLASDGSYLYFMTGDGTFDLNTGGANTGMSMLKLKPTARAFSVADYFTPNVEAHYSEFDRDLGSGGLLLLPHQSGPHPNEMISAGKAQAIFVVDRDNMGQYHSNSNNVVQIVLHGTAQGYFGSPAYWQQKVYYNSYNDYLSLYSVTNGRLSSAPISKSPEKYPAFGCTPSISSNGTNNGIVWCLQPSTLSQGGPAVILRAYDANSLATELYSSDQSGTRDQAGPAIKFSVPTVINGKVYVGTQTELDVYGLLTQNTKRHSRGETLPQNTIP